MYRCTGSVSCANEFADLPGRGHPLTIDSGRASIARVYRASVTAGADPDSGLILQVTFA